MPGLCSWHSMPSPSPMSAAISAPGTATLSVMSCLQSTSFNLEKHLEVMKLSQVLFGVPCRAGLSPGCPQCGQGVHGAGEPEMWLPSLVVRGVAGADPAAPSTDNHQFLKLSLEELRHAVRRKNYLFL